ncbi:NAD(P)-dependent oxidoreductase [Nocardioides marmoriginsengisoli]|uniref:NAD(P)-dependent oxidoreductase n=1 Tax=Nocardioides marmoriginsengisoli TaxID=661483 RepID=A0A3N0CHB9_9ACTN|nr:NAD(P)-dependent oxidoreductase [Nocardioides marmoriginsengisoli]
MGRVKVVVSGGTGVIGRAAVRALVDAGHDVDVLARSAANTEVIRRLGADPVSADLFDRESLARIYSGADVAINLATEVPVGYAAAWPTAWRHNDQLRTRAVSNVVAAARASGVRRIIQESASFVYADAGDAWISERDPIEITPATEPVAVGESHVQEYAGGFRAGVLLRFGCILGDDPLTKFWLRAAATGRPVGIGSPDAWTHLVHTDDLGTAVLAALHAPSGVYNVGAAPVRRTELVEGFAKAVGSDEGGYLGPVLRRLAGGRIEPMTRSLRISSDHFSAQTGWQPSRPAFDPAWFDAALEAQPVR